MKLIQREDKILKQDEMNIEQQEVEGESFGESSNDSNSVDSDEKSIGYNDRKIE